MERDANYVAVGAFILLVVAMAVGFVFWYTDARERRNYERYEIYFAGSVSGLNEGGPVRYLGVDVGRVRRMNIDTENPNQVQVIVEIDQTAPLSAATRASLNLQGVTGLLYVNLKEAPDADRAAPLAMGERYPRIESVASDFDTVLASMPELMARATSLLERVGRVFSDDNLEGLAETIQSLRQTTNELPGATRSMAQLLEDVRGTISEIRVAAENLRDISTDSRPQIQAALARMNEVADNLAQASARVDRFAENSEVQMGHFTEQGLFQLERLVRETRQAAREFRDLSRSLKENPSQILYEPPESGVEIAR